MLDHHHVQLNPGLADRQTTGGEDGHFYHSFLSTADKQGSVLSHHVA